jgi:hypothetical protein
MPELSPLKKISVCIKGCEGSLLVGVLGIAILLALTGSALIQVTSSMHNQELEACRNIQAFHAAESGIMMGANWLRNRLYFPTAGTFTPFSTLAINDVWVDVTINASTDIFGVVDVEISAEAYNDQNDRSQSHFIKRINCSVRQDDFGRYNMFVNKLSDPNWAGYGGGKVFNGRFHWNDPALPMGLNVNADNPANQIGVGVTFTGDVTVANMLQSTAAGMPLVLTGASGNNYGHGLKFRDGAIDAAYADKVFRGTFSSTSEAIGIPEDITNFASGIFGMHTVETLPLSSLDQGTGNAHYRPTLTFNGNGSAVYSYYSAGSVKTHDIPDVNNTIIYCRNNLNVRGVVQGNTSVVTQRLKSIAVVGDLVYADNDFVTGTAAGADNNHVPMNSTNCLALVSGYNVVFNPLWKETPSSAQTAIIGTINPGSGKLYCNAELIMAHPDGIAGNWGMEYWQTGSTNYQFHMQFCGSHVMNYWRATNNDQTHGGTNINYGYDRRLSLGVKPYGLPPIKGVNNTWIVSLSNWNEENIF